MIAWFIIAIITIGLFAYIAIFGVQGVTATAQGTSMAESVRRLEAASAALSKRAAPGSDGSFYLPVGAIAISGPNAGILTLPADMAEMGVTPYGTQMIYCPFGGTGTTADQNITLRMANGVTYSAGIKRIGDANYVMSGRPSYADAASNPNLLGFVMAPISREAPVSGCNAITKTGVNYTAPGMAVRPIIRDTIAEKVRVTKSAGSIFYVSPTGTGDGLNLTSPSSLTTAIQYWRTHPVKSMRIILSAGNYAIAPGLIHTSGNGYIDRPRDSTLSLEGTSPDEVQISQTSSAQIWFNIGLRLSNLTFAQESLTTISRGGDVRLDNVRIGPFAAYEHTHVTTRNIAVNGSAAASLIMMETGSQLNAQGSLILTYRANQNGILIQPGSKLNLDSVSYSITPYSGTPPLTYGIHINRRGQGSISNTNLTFNGPANVGITSDGDFSLTQSTLAFTSGGTRAMILHPGSRTTMNRSVLGGSNTPTVGVLDNGGFSLSGTDNQIRAKSACWAANSPSTRLFALPSGTGGVSDDEALPSLSATPTGGEVKAREDAIARNAERETLRTRNQFAAACAIG